MTLSLVSRCTIGTARFFALLDQGREGDQVIGERVEFGAVLVHDLGRR
jgi:hypothetical protein